ncbi:MAG: hypothetical protein HY700_05280 [Gemmatimonadetes bacterium]|nr:hypothetical protein [Gemmatimonadota bacterium]
MARRPVLLIHGYSDKGASFDAWKTALEGCGYDATEISICNYESLTNELTIKDIAEGLDRAMHLKAGLNNAEPFDAIVHSTGMLVMRAWLTAYASSDSRLARLRHLIGLAPATWGSPLAHKGRSWVGALFKGRKELGPDFMEAGDLVLDGLELGSRYTWDLAHRDLFGNTPFYGETHATPYVAVFCGNSGYGGLRGLVNEPGTDGTVRWAGCSLDSRKIVLDLTGVSRKRATAPKMTVPPPLNVDVPVVFVDGADHGSIIEQPPKGLIDQVAGLLEVESAKDYSRWQKGAAAWSEPARQKLEAWQQFVVRVVDERGDPVPDYNMQLLTDDNGKLEAFDTDVHTYRADSSLRCFHVNLSKLRPQDHSKLGVRLIASSGTARVGYAGVGTEKISVQGAYDRNGKWDAQFDLPVQVAEGTALFYPFTTTLLEVVLNREPLPLVGRNEVLWFFPKDGV